MSPLIGRHNLPPPINGAETYLGAILIELIALREAVDQAVSQALDRADQAAAQRRDLNDGVVFLRSDLDALEKALTMRPITPEAPLLLAPDVGKALEVLDPDAPKTPMLKEAPTRRKGR